VALSCDRTPRTSDHRKTSSSVNRLPLMPPTPAHLSLGGWNSATPWLTNPRFHRLFVDDAILQTAHGACRSSRGISPALDDVRAKPRKRLTSRLSSNLYMPTQPYPTFAQNPNFIEPDYPPKCVAVLLTPCPKTDARKPTTESQTPVPTCTHQNRKFHTPLNLSSPLKCVAVLSSKTAQDSISPPFTAPLLTKSKPI
jgi:hypothetical protein